MILTNVTVTGADEGLAPGCLSDLSARFPFVEWGILFSPKRQGSARYPGAEWRRALYKEGDLKLAAHLCGDAVWQFVHRDPDLLVELGHYRRVQFNFAADKLVPADLELLKQSWLSHPWRDLEGRPQNFIIQCNRSNDALEREMDKVRYQWPNRQVLMDGSGGRGVRPDPWPRPIFDVSCGYAGGITPDTVADDLETLAGTVGSLQTWIDLESGVRTGPDDQLDIEKVVSLLYSVEERCTKIKTVEQGVQLLFEGQSRRAA